MTKKRIAWKFSAPIFSQNLDRTIWPDHKLRLPYVEDNDDDDEDLLDAPSPYDITQKSKPFKIITTPFGAMRWDAEIEAANSLLSWTGHTNFNLSISAVNKLIHIAGVEAVKIFSRYRFLIVVGELFESSQVKVDIQRILCEDVLDEIENLPLDKATSKIVDDLIEKYKNYNWWIIYVLPNGRVETVCSSTENDDFNRLFTILYSTFSLVGGAIFIQ